MALNQTKKMILTAFFIAITIVLARLLSFYVNLFGVNSMRIGFSVIIIILAGIFLGLKYGMIVGAVADVLGWLMFESQPYYPGYTINAALYGMLPAIIFYFYNTWPSILKRANLLIAFISLVIISAEYYLLFLADKNVIFRSSAKTSYADKFTLPVCLAIFFITVAVFSSLTFCSYYFSRKRKELPIIILIALLSDVLINIPLGALHNHSITKAPYIYFLASRTILTILYFPIKASVFYILYIRLKKYFIEDKYFTETSQ